MKYLNVNVEFEKPEKKIESVLKNVEHKMWGVHLVIRVQELISRLMINWMKGYLKELYVMNLREMDLEQIKDMVKWR